MVACSKNTCFEGVKKLQNFGTLCVFDFGSPFSDS